MRRLAVLVLGALLVMVGAGSASAAPHALPGIVDCKTSPTPDVPGRGITGFFVRPPAVLPAPGDPFASNPTTSIYEQYGYAGLRFNTYDLGCGPDIARDPDATIGTAIANWIILLPKAAVAATGSLITAAFAPDFLGVFDPLIATVVDSLQRTVFEQWAFLVIGALGLLVIWKARQMPLASTATAIGGAILIMIAVTMVTRWPLLAGHAADQSVTTVLGSVPAGLNGTDPGAQKGAGQEAAAQMHDALLYRAWLSGTFGDTDSATTKKYGPIIFDATALTWAEAATLHSDPAAGKEIIDRKEAAFADAASEIKDSDPDAYDYLTGKRSDNRVGFAVLAALATLCAVPFLFMAGLLVLGALIIVRFGVMLFPAIATLGLFPPMRHLVTGIGSTAAAALINAMVFGVGAAVTVAGLGVLTDPAVNLPAWLSIILMLLLTIVMWVALRPFRRLTQMVGQPNHFAAGVAGPAALGRGAAKVAKQMAQTAAGVAIGVRAADRLTDPAPAPVPRRAEGESTPRHASDVVSVVATDLQPQQRPAIGPPPARFVSPARMAKPLALEPDVVHDPPKIPQTRFESATTDAHDRSDVP